MKKKQIIAGIIAALTIIGVSLPKAVLADEKTDGDPNKPVIQEDLCQSGLITNPRTSTKNALEIENFGQQGKYPLYNENNKNTRAFVIHNYNDSESVVVDNCGGATLLTLRNAKNDTRRPGVIGNGDFLRFQNTNGQKYLSAFVMKRDGNMIWDANGFNKGVVLNNTQDLVYPNNYAFTLYSKNQDKNLLDIKYGKNNESAFSINRDDKATNIVTKNNTNIEANGDITLKGDNTYVSKNGTNREIANLVESKPSSNNAKGNKGDYYVDKEYTYLCYADNQWTRITNDTNW